MCVTEAEPQDLESSGLHWVTAALPFQGLSGRTQRRGSSSRWVLATLSVLPFYRRSSWGQSNPLWALDQTLHLLDTVARAGRKRKSTEEEAANKLAMRRDTETLFTSSYNLQFRKHSTPWSKRPKTDKATNRTSSKVLQINLTSARRRNRRFQISK